MSLAVAVMTFASAFGCWYFSRALIFMAVMTVTGIVMLRDLRRLWVYWKQGPT